MFYILPTTWDVDIAEAVTREMCDDDSRPTYTIWI